MPRSPLVAPSLIACLLGLYLLHLGAVGFVGPDEPRYASIGREMARSGDWVTPRLDGQPWFEKPPLVYWTTAVGHLARLPDEWAARLPIALSSIAFLAFFYLALAREFSPRVALIAAAILGTSAGWMAYSFAVLTDLLMTVTLAAAMLVAVFDTRPARIPQGRGWLAGALLGLSILAKGFVPLALFAPLFLIIRGKRLATLAGAVAVAAPWYVLCWSRNGSAFWDDFFWKQHVARFFTPALEHVQPWWFFVPVLLAGLFPWTPLAALLARRKLYDDLRVRLLAAWVLYGMVFFSVSKNKLPGYILPLMPALAVVMAVAVSKCKRSEWWLAACALVLVGLPTVAALLPGALLVGLSKTPVAFVWGGLAFVMAAAGVWWLAWKGQRELAVLGVALAAGLGVVYLKAVTFPVLDQAVSVRAFSRSAKIDGACLDGVSRTWEYGLNYYANRSLAQCAAEERPGITVRDGRLTLVPR